MLFAERLIVQAFKTGHKVVQSTERKNRKSKNWKLETGNWKLETGT
jgi:hypothetical protein